MWACVNVISKAIASSTWEVFREEDNGNRDYQPNSRTYQLLNVRPNPEMAPIAFHETMIAVALLWGNSYAEIERDAVNRPMALWPISPDRPYQRRNMETGELEIVVRNFGRPETVLSYENVFHIHGLGFDGSCGLDLVSLASRSLLHALAAERFGLRYYENGTAMGGVLSTDQALEQTKLDAIRANIEKRVAGPDNAFKFLVLSGGMKWQSLTTTLNEGQHNETRAFLIEEVCRWFGVPPHKIAHLDRATFSNIEHEGIEFQRDGLRPWAKRGEQEVDYKLLPPGPMSVAINLDWAAEGDAKSKAETDSIYVQNGIMKRNEVRKRRGLNSIGSQGELLTVQVNMTTLDALAKGTTATPAANPNPAQPQRTPTGAPTPEQIQTATASGLFASAMRRCLRRQQHRAQEAAEGNPSTYKFRRNLDAQRGDHRRYIDTQLDDVFAALDRVGIDTMNASAVRRKMDDHLDDQQKFWINRYQSGADLTIDVEDRADEIAQELTDILEAVHA